MEFNITELREKRRPLWMTELNEESYANLLGGGGDIYKDRLPVDWPRSTGEETVTEEEIIAFEGEYVEEDYIS